MKVSPSIYSSKMSIIESVEEIRRTMADYIHVDCNKGLSEIYSDVKLMRKQCNLPIDMHIMDSDPLSLMDDIRKIKPDFVAFQYEFLKNPDDFFKLFIDGVNTGISITQDTEFEDVEKFIEKSDYVLLMTTTPGKSGGKFTSSSMDWVKRFRQKYPFKRIHVDGGVDDTVSFALKSIGVDCIVSGSYLMKSESMAASVINLKGTKSNIMARNFMIGIDALTSTCNQDSLLSAWSKIDQGHRGFCFAIGKSTWGILTDGDIRRYFISNTDASRISDLKIDKMVNYNPFSVLHDDPIDVVLDKLKLMHNKKLNFIVVVEDEKPVGILTLNSMLRT